MRIDCLHNPRLASYGRSIRAFPFLGNVMPIRIRYPDMTNASMQQPDISLVMPNAGLVSEASYAAFEAVFGVLCGSI